MNDYDRYSKYIVRSVDHIFKRFLDDGAEEVYESQSSKGDPIAIVEIDGSLKGEVVLNLPKKTLHLIAEKFTGSKNRKTVVESYADVAGELANLVTGTFANQMQYADQDILLAPPEFNEDPIAVKTLYENINISFKSSFGGFDVDLFYKDME